MRRSQKAATITKRKPPTCARKIVVGLRRFIREISPLVLFLMCCHSSGPGVPLIRLRRAMPRCRGMARWVSHKVPSCGIRDLYESAGQKVTAKTPLNFGAGGGSLFRVAEKNKNA